MLILRILAPLGLLAQYGKGSNDHGDAGSPNRKQLSTTTEYEPICTANVTVYDTTIVKVTNFVDYTVTVNTTTTNTCTESTTTTLLYIVSVTDTALTTTTATNTDSVTVTNTDWTTVTNTDLTTVTNTNTTIATTTATDTDSVTITTTDTDSTTVTTTDTTAATVTTTGTDAATVTTTDTDAVTITTTDTDSTTITQTLFSTTYDPCPKSCSISAERVNLYFWPSSRPHTYPATWFDESLSYTFTSPSVYMFIPSAQGTNTLNQPAGPSTSSWILPLDLYEVSTIANNGTGTTSQLDLADLWTECPKSVNPTAIATLVDSACNPILAAPTQVRSWAYPCNACGRFGLFDPPYAAPTLTGGLVEPPPVTVTAAPITVTETPVVVTTPPQTTGLLLIEYRDSNGNVLSTATVTTTGLTGGTVTSTVVVPASTTPAGTAPGGTAPGGGIPTSAETTAPSESGTFLPSTTLSASSSTESAPPVTAAGAKFAAPASVWIGLAVAVFWL